MKPTKESTASAKAALDEASQPLIDDTGRASTLYERHLLADRASDPRFATPRDQFEAFAHSVRDVIARRWALTTQTYERENPKHVYYLSNVNNLLLDDVAQSALASHTLTRRDSRRLVR